MSTLKVNNVQNTSGDNILGRVLQVVTSTRGDMTTSTSSSWATTGLEATITPTSSSSKVLIQCSGPMTGFAGGAADHNSGALKVYRGGSGGTSVESENRGLSMQYGSAHNYSDVHILYIDSPSTTSATTYTVMMKRTGGSSTYSFIRDGQQTASLVLMEIGA